MSAPSKPWESGNGLGLTQNAQSVGMNGNPMYDQGMYSSAPMPPGVGVGLPIPQGAPLRRSVGQRSSTRAPPIPPALGAGYQGYASSAMSYNSPYGMTGSYGASSYGVGGYGASNYGMGTYGASRYGMGGYGASSYGMGGYGAASYGMGGYGMSRYGGQQPVNNLESRFIQMAEESSRPAFDSIESLVQTFGSINFMMESTFGALYSSFRAVLGVAENFGRLRTLFGQVFSTFAVLRTFQWIYKKLLYYLGLRPDNPGREFIWQQAAGVGAVDPEARKTFWPVALFLGLVCSGPYLVWRLLNSLNIVPPPAGVAESSPETWARSSEPTMVAVARHAFSARSPSELTVRPKQTLLVAPQHFQAGNSDWVTVSDGRTTGLVPRTYLQVVGRRKLNDPAQATAAATSPADLVVDDPKLTLPADLVVDDPKLTSPADLVVDDPKLTSPADLIPSVPDPTDAGEIPD